MIKKVLTIAGSDCSGGAGIQADLKTIAAHKMYGMSVITALTAQNTTGVYGVLEASPEFIAAELDCVFQDIIPDAVKIGMVSNREIIQTIVQKLRQYQVKNIVVDPVMISTSGSKLLSDQAVETLVEELLPLADILTPNLKEAEVLCGFAVETEADMVRAAEAIGRTLRGAVLVKGGHLTETADDLLAEAGCFTWIRGERVDNPNTHGTGCTLSSAIACQLAAGEDHLAAVRNAKAYLTGALRAGLNLGKGSGPLDHTYGIEIKK